jgi:hypothetical protein
MRKQPKSVDWDVVRIHIRIAYDKAMLRQRPARFSKIRLSYDSACAMDRITVELERAQPARAAIMIAQDGAKRSPGYADLILARAGFSRRHMPSLTGLMLSRRASTHRSAALHGGLNAQPPSPPVVRKTSARRKRGFGLGSCEVHSETPHSGSVVILIP